jgi:FtsP/CotA-like multicopper oxidase with cupredoxin domain
MLGGQWGWGIAGSAMVGANGYMGAARNSSMQLDPTPYLSGALRNPEPNELGWKDTVKVYPWEVCIVLVRYAPIDGSQEYPFDPTVGPGYVWHCHIVDHEDNEMMRPDYVEPVPGFTRTYVQGVDY